MIENSEMTDRFAGNERSTSAKYPKEEEDWKETA